jgi:hypothetical protein
MIHYGLNSIAFLCLLLDIVFPIFDKDPFENGFIFLQLFKLAEKPFLFAKTTSTF